MNQPTAREIVRLEQSWTAPIAPSFPDLTEEPDVLDQLLESKRNPRTRKEYRQDLNNFFEMVTGSLPTTDTVLEFLHLDRHRATALVLKYKAVLFKKGLKEATVNRRLAALKALVTIGRKLGVCDYSLDDVKGEKVRPYRDTSGVGAADYKKVLDLCSRSTTAGKRDYALFKLLWENALRREEISQLDLADFDPTSRQLWILGKGRGTQQEIIGLSRSTCEALADWINVSMKRSPDDPLFIALDPANKGHRLTGDGIYKIVRRYCSKAGIKKRMSPHRIRHSSITAALDATDGNLRKVQKLSRHKNIQTLLIYDDNRSRDQQEISELLSGLTD